MNSAVVPSILYRIYWTGRYIERIDLAARSLLAILSAGASEDLLRSLAASLGLKYESPQDIVCKLLYDESQPSSILHAAKMVRLNLHGIGAERALREANLLVLASEDRIDCSSMDEVRKHLEDVLFAANKLGRIIEEDLVAPPTPPKHVLRDQLLHQQQ